MNIKLKPFYLIFVCFLFSFADFSDCLLSSYIATPLFYDILFIFHFLYSDPLTHLLHADNFADCL